MWWNPQTADRTDDVIRCHKSLQYPMHTNARVHTHRRLAGFRRRADLCGGQPRRVDRSPVEPADDSRRGSTSPCTQGRKGWRHVAWIQRTRCARCDYQSLGCREGRTVTGATRRRCTFEIECQRGYRPRRTRTRKTHLRTVSPPRSGRVGLPPGRTRTGRSDEVA